MSASTTYRDRIRLKIGRMKSGTVFTPKEFIGIASRGMVDMTLKSLADAGTIRRIARGLYDRPQFSEFLGEKLGPSVDTIITAYARRFRWHIVPSGANAANTLGLSTQVPAQLRFITDGPDKIVAVDSRTIEFTHAQPKDLAGGDSLSAMVIQALRHLGKSNVGAEQVQILRRKLSPEERERLLVAAKFASAWIYAIAKDVAKPEIP
jgi:hypothetical protein